MGFQHSLLPISHAHQFPNELFPKTSTVKDAATPLRKLERNCAARNERPSEQE